MFFELIKNFVSCVMYKQIWWCDNLNLRESKGKQIQGIGSRESVEKRTGNSGVRLLLSAAVKVFLCAKCWNSCTLLNLLLVSNYFSPTCK